MDSDLRLPLPRLSLRPPIQITLTTQTITIRPTHVRRIHRVSRSRASAQGLAETQLASAGVAPQTGSNGEENTVVWEWRRGPARCGRDRRGGRSAVRRKVHGGAHEPRKAVGGGPGRSAGCGATRLVGTG